MAEPGFRGFRPDQLYDRREIWVRLWHVHLAFRGAIVLCYLQVGRVHALSVQIPGHRLVVTGDDRELDDTRSFCRFLVLESFIFLQDKVVLIACAEITLLIRIALVYIREERAVPNGRADGVVECARKVVSGAVAHRGSLGSLRRGCCLSEDQNWNGVAEPGLLARHYE